MNCEVFQGRHLSLVRDDEAVTVCPYCFRVEAPGTAPHGKYAQVRPCDPCLDELAEHLALPEELDTRLKLDLDLIDG